MGQAMSLVRVHILMPDKYLNFAALASAEPPNAYSISMRNAGSPVVVVAPHGGGIEPGTSEIALAIAGSDLSYYLFEGKKVKNNRDLHITSSNFDEPEGLALMRNTNTVLAVHGEESDAETVYLGGLDVAALALLRRTLEHDGYEVREHANPQLQGLHKRNICNIGRNGAGVQLELSAGLRGSFFEAPTRSGRRKPTARLSEFATLIGRAVRHLP